MKSKAIACVLGLLMISTAVFSQAMKPHIYVADSRPKVQLSKIIPAQFGDWTEELQHTANIISPERVRLIERIYSQTLSRTYVNSAGERVMLSIAYGVDQRKGNELHYPEVCYPAQGFELTALNPGTLTTSHGIIPVHRMKTNLAGQRFEPVTYWTTVGDLVTLGGVDKRLKELAFGLKREIPDGLVFRVSTIDQDSAHSYAVQDSFVGDLISVLKPAEQRWLMGLL